jgi:hypothetical protein
MVEQLRGDLYFLYLGIDDGNRQAVKDAVLHDLSCQCFGQVGEIAMRRDALADPFKAAEKAAVLCEGRCGNHLVGRSLVQLRLKVLGKVLDAVLFQTGEVGDVSEKDGRRVDHPVQGLRSLKEQEAVEGIEESVRSRVYKECDEREPASEGKPDDCECRLMWWTGHGYRSERWSEGPLNIDL